MLNLDAGKTAVLVIDMQNDFCKPEGALCVADAMGTVPVIQRLCQKAEAAGVPVFFTADAHSENDPEFKMWPRHCVAGEWGQAIIDELMPALDEGGVVIEKRRYDPFYNTNLGRQLAELGIDTVVLCGTVANICVLAAAHSAALRYIKPIAVLDGISALNIDGYTTMSMQITEVYGGEVVQESALDFDQAVVA